MNIIETVAIITIWCAVFYLAFWNGQQQAKLDIICQQVNCEETVKP